MLLPLALLLAATPMDTKALKTELVTRHGETQRARIERGVDQVAALWRKEDGDLRDFVRQSFLAEPAERELAFQRFEALLEQVDGHFLEIGRELRKPTELDLGPMLRALDPRFAAWDPAAHLTEDLFENKVAFVALLNFPLTTLDERLARGPGWSRQAWAEARLTGRFHTSSPTGTFATSSRPTTPTPPASPSSASSSR